MFKFPAREEGQGLVEYALVLVLIAVVVIIILTVLGSAVTLVFAQVVGGFSGQSLTKTGTEYIVLEAGVSVTGGGTCNVSISDATVAVVQDGELLKNTTGIEIPISGGGRSEFMRGSTNNVGLATGLGGELSGASCGSNLTIGNTGYRFPMNP